MRLIQSCRVISCFGVIRSRRFVIIAQMMGTEMSLETLISLDHLTWSLSSPNVILTMFQLNFHVTSCNRDDLTMAFSKYMCVLAYM